MGLFDRLFSRKPAPESDEQVMARALAAFEAGDHATAAQLWRPLAERGHARACNNLGGLYAYGQGVEKNADEARNWIKRAAELGDALGQCNYAWLLYEGDGAWHDYGEAAKWYRRAAEQGDARAQDMLSFMLFEGLGEPQNLEESREWAQKAAAQGAASAMTRLGKFHHDALGGVARDPAQAVAWWIKAANAGDSEAQALLGAAYHLGQGVERNDVHALVWLTRAEAQGQELARNFLPCVRNALTQAQLAEAEMLLRAGLT
jgi:hypothetical protein